MRFRRIRGLTPPARHSTETRMRPSHLLPIAGVTFLLRLVAPLARGDGKLVPQAPDPKPVAANGNGAAVNLPVTRIVLFNAGVGYFHREGKVDGDARLELRFPEADVNDLIKSLVISD